MDQPLFSAHQILWRINNHYQQRLRIILRRYGLNYLEYAIITELVAHKPLPIARSYAQLAAELCVDPTTIAKSTQKAPLKNLVHRYIDREVDQRAWVVTATWAAKQKLKAIRADLQKVETELLANLGLEGCDGLQQLYTFTTMQQPAYKAKAQWWRIRRARRLRGLY